MPRFTVRPISNQADLSISTSSVALTVPAGATHAVISIEAGGGAVNWVDDGGAAVAGSDHELLPGDSIVWMNPAIDYSTRLTNFRAIRRDSTNGIMNITYYAIY